ncbi:MULTISPECIES: hypothetical protein, partial [Protofrankia]|uniref:hypothetical protein n=1 Tax=Protofrankia TaxID=2994361 RepID=UPI0019CF84AC
PGQIPPGHNTSGDTATGRPRRIRSIRPHAVQPVHTIRGSTIERPDKRTNGAVTALSLTSQHSQHLEFLIAGCGLPAVQGRHWWCLRGFVVLSHAMMTAWM